MIDLSKVRIDGSHIPSVHGIRIAMSESNETNPLEMTASETSSSTLAPTTKYMSYAHARLWLGIGCVATFTSLALLLIVFRLPYRIFTSTLAHPLGQVGELLGFVFFYLLVQGAFDFFGGYILPKEYGRSKESLLHFIMRWLRGASLQGLALFLCALLLFLFGRMAGVLGIVVFLVLLTGLIYGQGFVAALIGGFHYKNLDDTMDDDESDNDPVVRIANVSARYFTGGIVGLPDRLGIEPQIIIPHNWLERFSADDLDMLFARREEIVRRDLRERGLLLALAWQLLSFTTALAVPHSNFSHAAGIVTFSCWSTIFSFIGILVLPTLSRWGVFAADSYVDPQDEARFIELLEMLERDQDEEDEGNTIANAIFHPIPCVRTRKAHIGIKAAAFRGRGFWHAARTNLYLSWASLGLLSRAVHCNIGRPEVWVLLPSD